jgi:hypothetical protein
VIHQTFFIDDVLKQILCRFEVIPTPIEYVLIWKDFLNLFGVVLEKWVLKALINRCSLVGVEAKHAREKVGQLRSNGREKFLPFLFGPFW